MRKLRQFNEDWASIDCVNEKIKDLHRQCGFDSAKKWREFSYWWKENSDMNKKVK